MQKKEYNTVIIGAGPAGYVAALRGAQLGIQVAVVDAWLNDGTPALGGVCLNVGCIPSKALLESSHYYTQISTYQDHGIEVEKATFNLTKMMRRKAGITKKFNQGIQQLFKHHGIDWIQGRGRLLDAHTVEITAHDVIESEVVAFEVKAKHIVLATGSRPIELTIAPFDGEYIIDSSDALALDSVPETLGIIGAGAIGLELGTVWQRLGSQVTLFEAAENFLPLLDRTMARQAQKQVLSASLSLNLHSQVTAVEKVDNGVNVSYNHAAGENQQAHFEKLLVAVGRRPNTESLWPEDLLDRQDNGEITVDAQCRTKIPHVFAIGDIVRGPKLAHKGSAEGVMVAECIAGQSSTMDYDGIPSVIYTHPEIASVGLNETQLKAQGIEFNVGQASFSANGRALAAGEGVGSVKIWVDATTHKILGAQIIAANAAELIQEIVTVMAFSGTAEDIADIIHAHPSLVEVVQEAAASALGQAIHQGQPYVEIKA